MYRQADINENGKQEIIMYCNQTKGGVEPNWPNVLLLFLQQNDFKMTFSYIFWDSECPGS